MKKLPDILLVIGALLLFLLAAGRLVGSTSPVMHDRIIDITLFSNTVFLLAILAKLFEKK